MDDNLLTLQGKLSQVSVNLETFVPTTGNAAKLSDELRELIGMLDEFSGSRRFSFPPSSESNG